jgi:signal transduction histidine kinase
MAEKARLFGDTETRQLILDASQPKEMKALGRKDTFSMTYRQTDADGPVYVNMKISRMQDEHFIIIGFTNVNAEVRETMTKNRALTEALALAEQARKENTKLLSGMSHKLRTPLNAIIGLDTLAMKNENLDDNTREYLEKIKDSSGQLLSILNDVLSPGNEGAGSDEASKGEVTLENITDEERRINKAAMRVLVVDDDHVRIEIIKVETEECSRAEVILQSLRNFHQIVLVRRDVREILLDCVPEIIKILVYISLGILVRAVFAPPFGNA